MFARVVRFCNCIIMFYHLRLKTLHFMFQMALTDNEGKVDRESINELPINHQ